MQYLKGCVTLILLIDLAEWLNAQGQTFSAVTHRYRQTNLILDNNEDRAYYVAVPIN